MQILLNDPHIIVINKPAGTPSTCQAHNTQQASVAAFLLERYPEQLSIGINGQTDAGLVHRLDNHTSGILIAAKTTDAYSHLTDQFRQRTIKKYYTALVIGQTPEHACIDIAIAHHPKKKKKMIACPNQDIARQQKARSAITYIKTIKRFVIQGEHYSLVDIEIITGMRHQIRVHLSHMGYPIIGDSLYQNSKKQKLDKNHITGHFLHACKTIFMHPHTHEKITLTCELPSQLQKLLNKMTKQHTGDELE